MKTTRMRLSFKRDSDVGVGLVEIMISMLLLGLLAVAILPLLVNTLELGPKNAAIAAGNQLVADGLTRAETQGLVSCMNVQSLESSFPATAAATAPAGEYGISITFAFQPESLIQPGSCPPGPLDYPSTVEVLVTAVRHAGTPRATVLAEVRQLIYVALP